MKLEDARAVLESLEELSVDPVRFAWGPSYPMAKQRRKAAIKIMRKVVKKLEPEAVKKVEPKTVFKPKNDSDE